MTKTKFTGAALAVLSVLIVGSPRPAQAATYTLAKQYIVDHAVYVSSSGLQEIDATCLTKYSDLVISGGCWNADYFMVPINQFWPNKGNGSSTYSGWSCIFDNGSGDVYTTGWFYARALCLDGP